MMTRAKRVLNFLAELKQTSVTAIVFFLEEMKTILSILQQVIEKLVEIWETCNKQFSSKFRVPTAFLVIQNSYLCFDNALEARKS